MFSTLNQAIELIESEGRATQRIMDALTDRSLNQAETAEDRTLGRMAWHVTTTVPEIAGHTGLKIDCELDKNVVPKAAKEIAESYRQALAAFLKAMREQWNDQSLQEEKDMYGERWTIGAALQSLILHTAHHRGQMTVLMRQAGLKVPGIYGPARENWSAMGMEAPRV